MGAILVYGGLILERFYLLIFFTCTNLVLKAANYSIAAHRPVDILENYILLNNIQFFYKLLMISNVCKSFFFGNVF